MNSTATAGAAEVVGQTSLLLRLPALLVRPRRTFRELARRDRPSWLTPLVTISIAGLLYTGAAGWARQRAASMGADPLPPDFQYYSQQQQAQYLQALEATRGPTFLYVLPAVGAVTQVWLGWLITGSVLHLSSTILGGRSTSTSVLSIAAWAGLPFAARFLVRAGFVLLAGRSIVATGLSGFAPDGAGAWVLFSTELLGLVDVFLLWHIALLGVGLASLGGLARGKVVSSVALAEIVALLVQAVPATIVASLAGLTVIRPFLF